MAPERRAAAGGRRVQAFVALGANLDDPVRQVRQAIAELGAIEGTRVLAVSSLYRTAPVGYADQPDFINAVASLGTTLPPRALLDALQAIEDRHGRRRTAPNAPRTLDLDLLTYDDAAIDDEGLTVPHPRMHERAFVLVPLAEIAPRAQLRGGMQVAQVLARMDRRGVEKIHGA
ncbi:MAG TPA: 2-amino-4-hydroxy-6-hydroxymethyldihydropteridine diphosphokinase [Burkholderiales bacterium]|nr:2-amino-4-hydroxy-6-hydroxymethyldihydropteridine diphosphokinase [Burkholderiales bacterium]